MKNAKLLWRILGYVLIPALFFCFGNSLRAQDTWKKVSAATELTAGDEVIIAAGTNAFSGEVTTGSSAWAKATTVAVANDEIKTFVGTSETDYSKPRSLIVEFTGDALSLKDKYTNKYLTSASKTNGISSTDSKVTVTLTTDGIRNVAMETTLRFNSSGFRFYKDQTNGNPTVTGTATALYKKQAAETPTTPFVTTDNTEVSYTIQPTANLNETLRFTAGNLENDLTVSVASATEGKAAVISVTPTSVSKETSSFDLTLTTSGLAEGEYSDIITIKSGSETMATVTVKLNVEMNYPYKKITTDAELKEGTYLIVCDTKNAAAGAMSGSFLSSVTVAITDNTINDRATAEEFLLEKNGTQWYIKNVESGQYLKTTAAKAAAYDGTAFPWTIGIAAGTATITSSGENHGNLYYNSSSPRFLNYTSAQTAIQLYKKQVPEAPTCDPVKVASDGAVDVGSNTATIHWDAPDKLPEIGYKVTLTGVSDGYNQEREVDKTEETQVEFTGLTPQAEYRYTIVSVCGTDFTSDPVTDVFMTNAAATPKITINSPNNNTTIFTGDVAIEFTTEYFDLDATHLVKAELKEYDDTDQVNAPVLKTLYTQSSPLTISGLADGKYHVDLYMVEVTPKTEGTGNDTTEVGFNGSNYVHRTFEVKHPAINFAPKTLKLTTFLGAEATDTVKVTGWALPESSSVSFASNSANFIVTPASLAQTDVMAEGGAKIAVTYNGADASATAEITATCGDNISATFTVNAIARDTLANLKGIYSKDKNDTVLVRGKMVVTHKDSYNFRIWVQDIDKENGASMLLYNVKGGGYDDIEVGDVLENVAGAVNIYNGLYEFTPLAKLEAVAQDHAIYVDTLTVDYINNNIGTVQNALVCVENVSFAETGNFVKNSTYTLKQDTKELNFYTTFNNADYIGNAIPTVRLHVVGILSVNTGKPEQGTYIVARNSADMAEAPCLVPTNFFEEVHSDEATMEWEGLADKYSVRYGKVEADLTSATATDVTKKSFTATNLDALTTYYYQVKSLCSATNESEWSAVQSFTTLSATQPAINMVSPVGNPTFTDSVKVSFRLKNVTLKADDTTASIVFSDGFTVDNLTDTVYMRAMPSGDYSLQVILMKDGDTLNPSVKSNVRYFSVKLPDVAKPVFTPATGRYKDSVEVTLNCDTEGASIFYAQGEGEWVAYAAGSKILLKESATLKAFACKERMDTSAVATESYTIEQSVDIEGEIVFEEPFDKITVTSDGSANIKDNLDEYTNMPGWSGDNIYQGKGGCVKFGTTSKLGYLQTPALDLTANEGKFMLSFDAMAYNNAKEKDSIKLIVNGVAQTVTGLPKDEMKTFVFTFTSGTESTTIRFSAIDASSNRFYLDNVRIYQVLPNVPRLTATPAMFEMNTVQGTPASQKVTVKGNLLASDVTVSCQQMNDNFSVSAETLTKEAVMGENGAELTVTFNASVAEDSAKIELVSGDLRQTVMVRAFATSVVEVENIAALRAGEQNTLYKVKGQVVVTAVDGNSTWVQDATAAIQIYGATGATYAVGDGITGIVGTLSDYHGLIELVPSGAQPAATTHNNVVEPQVMTVEELNEKGAEYSSRLIRINGLALSEAEGNWSGGKSYAAADEAGNDIVIYTTLSHGDYIGEALPEGKFDLIAIAGYRDGTVQVSPRVKEDIMAVGGGDEDDCEAPTNLMYSGSTKITVKWNGSANEYKLALLSKDGKDTVMTKMLTATEYTFGDEVKPNVEYGWAVASVCENGKLVWAKGQNFQIETANEEAELQADVYPNPTDGVVYIKLAENVRMEIFTLGGTVLRSEELAAGRNEIRLDQSGIYFIRLTNGTATTVRRVVVR